MPIGHPQGITAKGRPLEIMTHMKRSIIEVKAEENYLAHALISIARLTIQITTHIVREKRYVLPLIIYRYRFNKRCRDTRADEISGAFKRI
jgi:hypothetical protein